MSTEERLIEILGLVGAKPVSIRTITEPRMRKSPYKNVVKVCWRNGFVGTNYQAAVNRRRQYEGLEPNFKVEALWRGKGEHIEGTSRIVRHKETGQLYLVFFLGKSSNRLERYFSDGKFIKKEAIVEYLVENTPSKKQGVTRPILYQTIAIENISAIRVDGRTYWLRYMKKKGS